MKDAETVLWGIHGGKTGDSDDLFLKKNCVAVGWPKVGGLGALKADREAFKARVAEVYPEKKPGAIPNNAGQLFRFVHEMKPGDIVGHPSKRHREVHLSRRAILARGLASAEHPGQLPHRSHQQKRTTPLRRRERARQTQPAEPCRGANPGVLPLPSGLRADGLILQARRPHPARFPTDSHEFCRWPAAPCALLAFIRLPGRLCG